MTNPLNARSTRLEKSQTSTRTTRGATPASRASRHPIRDLLDPAHRGLVDTSLWKPHAWPGSSVAGEFHQHPPLLRCCPPESSEHSGSNADDRLSLEPLGGVEGCNGFVEGCGGSDVGAQPSVPHPLRDLTQLGAIGLDDEIHCQAVSRAGLDGADDGHQRSSSLDQGRGALLDVAADDIEDQID